MPEGCGNERGSIKGPEVAKPDEWVAQLILSRNMTLVRTEIFRSLGGRDAGCG